MSARPDESPGAGSAGPQRTLEPLLTDVFDEERGRILVPYPPGFIARLTVFGIAAFAVTGLLGYDRADFARFPDEMTPPEAALFILDRVFNKPWPIFLFFCVLILALQGSVLRAPALARFRRATFLATGVSMAIVAVVYLYRTEVFHLLGQLVDAIVHGSGRLRALVQAASTNAWTYLALDVALLALLFGQAAWGWARRRPGQLSNAPIDLRTGQPVAPLPEEKQARLVELIAGDLIVRGGLAGLLGLLFWYPVVSLLVRALGQEQLLQPGSLKSGVISFCTVSVPGTCTYGFSWELWSINVLVMVFSSAGGLALLAFLVQQEAMRIISTDTEGRPQDPFRVGHEILASFFDILLSPFNRRPRSRIGRRVSRDVQGPLRRVFWPALVFLGVVGAAGLADFIQRSLQCPKFYESAGEVATRCELQPIVSPIISHTVENGLPIALFGFLMVTGPLAAFAVMFARRRAASNALHFLAWIALSNALPIAIIMVALTLVNWGALFLAHLVDLSAHRGTPVLWASWLGVDSPTRVHPFYPGLFSLTLYAALVGYYVAVQARSRRRRGLRKPE